MEESKVSGFTSKKFAGSQFVFNRIRGKIRDTATKGDTLFSFFRSRDPSEYGKLTVKIFLFVLTTVGVKLDDEEVEYILKYYTNFKGEVDYLKFYKSLDMSVPEGYLNPEYFFDALPQPYRLISKILEFEILDKAWLDIVRRHPEVQVDSDGEQLVRLRNQNLNLSCLPTFTSEQHVLVKDISSSRTNPNVYMVNSVGLFTVTDSHNGKSRCTLSVFSGRNDANINICGVSSKNVDRDIDIVAMSCLFPASDSEIEGDNNKSNSAVHKKGTANETVDNTAASLGTDNGDKEIAMRLDLVVVEVQGHTASIVFSTSLSGYSSRSSSSSSSSSSSGSSSTPTIPVSLSDDGLILSALKGTTLCLYSLAHSDASEFPELDQPGRRMGNIAEEAEVTEFIDIDHPKIAKDPTCVIDLSSFFSQASGPSEGSSEPATSSSIPTTTTTATTHSPVKSGSKVASNPNTQATAAAANTSRSVTKILPEIKNLFLFPLSPPNTSDRKSNKDKLKSLESLNTEKRFLQYLLDFGIAILWEGIPEWMVLGMQDNASAASLASTAAKSGEDPIAIPVTKEKQLLKGGSSKNKVIEAAGNATATSSAANVKSTSHLATNIGSLKPSALASEFPFSTCVNAYESGRWQLSSAVTASCLDDDRSLLGLGLCDGSVELWDLRSLSLCGGAQGRHETAVKSMSIVQGKGLSLVSGALDGSLCFFSITAGIPSLLESSSNIASIKAPDQSLLSSVLRDLRAARSGKYQWGILTMKLSDFRHDVCCPILQINRIPRTSFFVTLTGEGEYILYDCDSIELLGVIKPKPILPGMKPSWRPLCKAHLASCAQPMSVPVPSPSPPATATTAAASVSPVQSSNSKTLAIPPVVVAAASSSFDKPLPLTLKPYVCTDPLSDYPYKWQETRRPPGYYTTPREAIDILKPLQPFNAVTPAGFLSLFRFSDPDVAKDASPPASPQAAAPSPMMAGIFTLDQMLKSFCPGIAAVNKQLVQELKKGRYHEHTHDVASPKSLFTLLTAAQRMDANLIVSQVETLRHFLSNPPLQDKVDKKSTKSPPKGKLASVSRASSFRSTSDTKRGSLIRADSGLTEKKLLALHSSFNPQLAVVEDLRFQSQVYRQRPWSNVKDVTEVANNRAKLGAVFEPKSRNKVILNRLQELSNMFDS